MGFLLLRDEWQGIGHDRTACGAFVLEVDCAGERRFYASRELDLLEFPGGPGIHCEPAILNSPTFTQQVDPYSRQFTPNAVDFTLASPRFPVARLVRAGQSLEELRAKVRWLVTGKGFTLADAFLLVDGLVTSFQYSEAADTVQFSVVDNQLSGDRLFPPRAVTMETFSPASIPADSFGRCYPVVVGAVTKLPVIDISAAKTRYLVMDDPVVQFSGTPVSAVYDNDGSKAINSQATATDIRGDSYWYVDITGAAATSQDVTADVDNGIPGRLIDAIFYLLNGYSNKQDLFDMASLRKLHQEFNAIELAIVFNSVVDGGVVQVIRERLIREFPLTIIQRGSKLFFQSLLWDRDVVKVLSTDTNIIQVVAEPAETDRALLANDFVASGGMSGLRGDALSAVSRNRFNDAMCLTCYGRYGELGKRSVSIPDVASSDGVVWLMNWLVQTHAVKRVRATYLCTLDAVDLNPWDTVRVFDHYQGWTHGPLFKVTGVQYGETNGVQVSLISLDDAFDVYAVNRKPYSSLELLGAEWV